MIKRSNWKSYNLTLTNAGETYSQQITKNARYIAFKCRPQTGTVPVGDLKYSFVDGEIDTKYITLPYPMVWQNPVEVVGTKTIYFQCDVAGVIVEIEEWN